MPGIQCKGLCHRSCGLIPLTQVEFDYVKAGMLVPRDDFVIAAGPSELLLFGDDGQCPLLVEGRCSVHPNRPFACRAYGVVDDPKMQCQWGCKPDALLTNKEVSLLLNEIDKLNAET